MLPDNIPLSLIGGPLLLSLVAVTALVICDFRGNKPGRFFFKPLAAAAFIWLALQLDATDTVYGRYLFAGLIACLLGDLLLMPDNKRTFLAGLFAFLCGHLLFAVAFVQLPHNTVGLLLAAVPGLLLAVLALRWLAPHVPDGMQIPVRLYIVVITGMLLCSGLTAGHPAAPWIIAGAWGFAASDLAVAKRQFVDESRSSALWGSPLYFFSQMILATSVALI